MCIRRVLIKLFILARVEAGVARQRVKYMGVLESGSTLSHSYVCPLTREQQWKTLTHVPSHCRSSCHGFPHTDIQFTRIRRTSYLLKMHKFARSYSPSLALTLASFCIVWSIALWQATKAINGTVGRSASPGWERTPNLTDPLKTKKVQFMFLSHPLKERLQHMPTVYCSKKNRQ